MRLATKLFLVGMAALAVTRVGLAADETIVVRDQPIVGEFMPPATEDGFSFKLKETGHVLKFKWADLGDAERKRVQKMVGLNISDTGKPAFGKKMKGARLTLNTDRVVEGYEDEARSTTTHVMLRTSRAPSLPILRSEIKMRDEFEGYESDFFSPKEVYDRIVLEKPPAGAQDHYEMAKTCATMTLYETGLHHLEMAIEKDELIKERIKDFQAELIKKLADQQAEDLYGKVLTYLRGEDFDGANELIDRLARNFPNSDWATKAKAMQPDVVAKREVDVEKRVITAYYRYFADILTKKTNSLRKEGPSVPGKMVTDRKGNVYRGLVKSESDEETVLQRDNLEVHIAQGDIVSKTDVDLNNSVGKPWKFSDLKAWATDADGGLGKEIAAAIAKAFKIPDADVKRIWGNRLARTLIVKDGKQTMSPCYTTRCDAFYGRASWLRDGAPWLDPMTNQAGAVTGVGQPRRQPNQRNPQQQQQDDRPAHLSTDPDIWWTCVPPDQRVSIMRAIAAEKLFNVENVGMKTCPECGGAKMLEFMNTSPDKQRQVCPYCRAIGGLYWLIYR